MKRFVGLVAVASLFALFIGCADDVFVEPPPSLIGDYDGTFSVKVGNTPAVTQEVNWRFTTATYQMRVSDASPDTICCNSAGEYTLSSNVELNEINPVLDPFVCNQEGNPKGVFGLDQSKTDTVLLKRVSNDTTMELTLIGPQ